MIGRFRRKAEVLEQASAPKAVRHVVKIAFPAPLRTMILIIFLMLFGCERSGPAAPSPNQVAPSTGLNAEDLEIQANDAIRKGITDQDAREFLKAEEFLRQALISNPKDARIYLFLGNLYAEGGVRLGIAASAWGGAKKCADMSRDNYEKALEINPSLAEAHQGLGAYYKTRNPEKSLEHLRRVLDANPNDYLTQLSYGGSLFEARKYDEAEHFFQEKLVIAQKNNDVTGIISSQEYLGRIFLETGRLDEAEKYLSDAAKALDRRTEHKKMYRGCPYQALGKLYAKLDRKEEMVENYMKAAEMESHIEGSQVLAAWKCLRTGHLHNAEKYADRTVALDKGLIYKLFRLGIITGCHFARWFGMADNDATEMRLSNLTPDQARHEAFAYYKIGQYDNALKSLNRALEGNEFTSDNIFKGFLLLFRRQYKEAEELFRLVLIHDGPNLGSEVGLGHLDIIRMDYSSAEERFDRVINLIASGSWGSNISVDYQKLVTDMALLGKGWLFANQNRHEEAIKYFDEILGRQTEHVLALLGKGNSLLGLERNDEAERVFQQVLHVEPQNPYALAGLGSIYLNREENEKAESMFRSAIANHQDGYTCPYEGLGLIYLKQGRTEDAKLNFKKSIEINPNVEYKKFNGLAKIYIQEGRLEEAEVLLKKSKENYPYDNEADELLKKMSEFKQH